MGGRACGSACACTLWPRIGQLNRCLASTAVWPSFGQIHSLTVALKSYSKYGAKHTRDQGGMPLCVVVLSCIASYDVETAVRLVWMACFRQVRRRGENLSNQTWAWSCKHDTSHPIALLPLGRALTRQESENSGLLVPFFKQMFSFISSSSLRSTSGCDFILPPYSQPFLLLLFHEPPPSHSPSFAIHVILHHAHKFSLHTFAIASSETPVSQ